MKLIDCSTPKYPNAFTMVDDEDFDWLSQFEWHQSSKIYVIMYAPGGKTRGAKMMHHIILPPKDGHEIDHIDRNPLNNQRANLRICTRTENNWNRRKTSIRMTSQYKGVYWDARDKRFVVSIMANGIRIRLGRFRSEIDAAMAYNIGAIKYHGEFAYLNEIKAVQ